MRRCWKAAPSRSRKYAVSLACHPSWSAIQRSPQAGAPARSEEHTSELQSLMRISYAVFCLKKKIQTNTKHNTALPPPHITQQITSLPPQNPHPASNTPVYTIPLHISN